MGLNDILKLRNEQLNDLGIDLALTKVLPTNSSAKRVYEGFFEKSVHVAVKEYGPDDMETHFERDIEILRKWHHPNIVRYRTNVKPANDTVLVVLDWVQDSQDLYKEFSWLKERGNLKQADRHAAVEKLLSAVEYVHKSGLIHRDLHPGNILVNEKGEPILVDFGLARKKGTEASKSVVGNTDYRSPQHHGRATLTEYSDIYLLGMITYELFTDQFETKGLATKLAGFLDEDKKTAYARLRDCISPDHFHEAGQPLSAIVKRALAPTAKESYQSVATMRLDLNLAFRQQEVKSLETMLESECNPDTLKVAFDRYQNLFPAERDALEILSDSVVLSNVNKKLNEQIDKIAAQYFADVAGEVKLSTKISEKISKLYANTRNFMNKFCLDAEDYNSPEGLKRIGLALVQNGIFDSKDLKARCHQISQVLNACPSRQSESKKVITTLEYVTKPDTIIPIPTDMLLPARKAYFESRNFEKALEKAKKINVDYMRAATLAEIHAREALRLLDSSIEGKEGLVGVVMQPSRDVRFASHVKQAVEYLSAIDDDKLHLWFVQAPWNLVKFIAKNPELMAKCTQRFGREDFQAWIKKIEEKPVPRLDSSDYADSKKTFPLRIGETEIYQPLIYQILLDTFTFEKGNYVFHKGKVDAKLIDALHIGTFSRNVDLLNIDLWAKTYTDIDSKYSGTQEIAIKSLEKVLEKDQHNQRVRREIIQRCHAVKKAQDSATLKEKIIEHGREFLHREKENADIRLLLADTYLSTGKTDAAVEQYKILARGFIEMGDLPCKVPDGIQQKSIAALGQVLVKNGRLYEMMQFVQGGQVKQEVLRKLDPWKSLGSLIEQERHKYQAAPLLIELLAQKISLGSAPETIEKCLKLYDDTILLAKRSGHSVDHFLQYKLKIFAKEGLKINLIPDEKASKSVIRYKRDLLKGLSKLPEKMKDLENRKVNNAAAISSDEEYDVGLKQFCSQMLTETRLRFGDNDTTTKRLKGLESLFAWEGCTPASKRP